MEIILIAAVIIGFAVYRLAVSGREVGGLTTGYTQPVERQTEYIIATTPTEYAGVVPAHRYPLPVGSWKPTETDSTEIDMSKEVSQLWGDAIERAAGAVISREIPPKQDDDLDEMFRDLWNGPNG